VGKEEELRQHQALLLSLGRSWVLVASIASAIIVVSV